MCSSRNRVYSLALAFLFACGCLQADSRDDSSRQHMGAKNLIDKAIDRAFNTALEMGCRLPTKIEMRVAGNRWEMLFVDEHPGGMQRWRVDPSSNTVDPGTCQKGLVDLAEARRTVAQVAEVVLLADNEARAVFGNEYIKYALLATLSGRYWQIEYHPQDPQTLGGGMKYIIDSRTRDIVRREHIQ